MRGISLLWDKYLPRYRGARLIAHWLIDQICKEYIGVSSNRFILLTDQLWLIDQFLAAKVTDPLSGPLCTVGRQVLWYSSGNDDLEDLRE